MHKSIGVHCAKKVWVQQEKKRKLYEEADPVAKAEFSRKVEQLQSKTLVYVDETGFDEFYYRTHAYSKKGNAAVGKVRGRTMPRTNLVAGLCSGKIVAPLFYKQSTKYQLFEEWFENSLLTNIPRKSIIILDNAAFHRKTILRELARKNKCHAIFLPPYSPDLNPIEKRWANLKKWLRQSIYKFPSFLDAVAFYFKTD